jgi:hypothetical protein
MEINLDDELDHFDEMMMPVTIRHCAQCGI